MIIYKWFKRQGTWLQSARPQFDIERCRNEDFSSLRVHTDLGPLSLLQNEYRSFPRGKTPSIELHSQPLPSVVAAHMWTLVSTSGGFSMSVMWIPSLKVKSSQYRPWRTWVCRCKDPHSRSQDTIQNSVELRSWCQQIHVLSLISDWLT